MQRQRLPNSCLITSRTLVSISQHILTLLQTVACRVEQRSRWRGRAERAAIWSIAYCWVEIWRGFATKTSNCIKRTHIHPHVCSIDSARKYPELRHNQDLTLPNTRLSRICRVWSVHAFFQVPSQIYVLCIFFGSAVHCSPMNYVIYNYLLIDELDAD